MTAELMQYNFELKLGYLHSLNKPFTSYDVSAFLNKAQDDLVNELYSNKEFRADKHFESDEKIRTELSSLIRSYSYTAGQFVTGPEDNSDAVYATMPSEYLYSIKENATVQYFDCNGNTATERARVLPIRHDEYEMGIDDPFSSPYEKLIWRLDYGVTGSKLHELIHKNGQLITLYSLRYIKTPNRIDVNTGDDCELHESLHEEIVDRAVRIAMASLPAPEENNVEQKQQT